MLTDGTDVEHGMHASAMLQSSARYKLTTAERRDVFSTIRCSLHALQAECITGHVPDRLNFHVLVQHAMNAMLEGVMAYLEKNGLVEFDRRNDDDAGFIDRTNRLQWYVFLAKRFGLDRRIRRVARACVKNQTALQR